MKRYLFISIVWTCLLGLSAPLGLAQEYTPATQLTLIGKAAPGEPFFHRIDTLQYKNIPSGVKKLLTQSAGMAIAFKTNSKHIYAKWTTKTASLMGNMNPIGQKGLNLYIKRDGRFQYAGVGQPTLNATAHSATLVENVADGEKECLIYLPLYEEITGLELGVTPGSTLAPIPNPFKGTVLIYGSSITQGASASRTGLAYPSVMARNTGIHFINLGLSGSAKMEPAVADMITSFNADAYILDCVPNSNSSDITANTASLVKKIRNRHPSSPIILIQSVIREIGNFNLVTKNNVTLQNQLFKQEYEKLVAEGIQGLSFISAEDLLGHDHEGTIDGTHPNDLGFERMIEVIQPAITPVILQAIEAGAASDVTEEPEPGEEDYAVSTVAGGAEPGDLLGPGAESRFKNVQCLAIDSKGNIILSDRANHKIKKISPEGVVSVLAGTVAGFADGDALSEAQFRTPSCLAYDKEGKLLVADHSNHRIRMIDKEGVVSTLAGSGAKGWNDGPASLASFSEPYGLAVNAKGEIFVGEMAGSRVRKIIRNGNSSLPQTQAKGRSIVLLERSSSGLRIQLQGTGGKQAVVSVYAVAGNLLAEKRVSISEKDTTFFLPVSLTKGVYIVSLQKSGGIGKESLKFIF